MKKSKKWMIVLAIILVPVIGLGFNYFSWHGEKDTSKQALTVDGGITVQEIAAEKNIVPGDKICDAVGFNIKSTAPSFLRVKVESSYSYDGNSENTTSANIYEIKQVKDNWIKGNDGYYYYTKAVDKNSQSSVPFVDSIYFTVEAGEDVDANQYQNKYIHAKVTAEMIQAKYGVFEDAWGIHSGDVYDKLKEESDKIN